MRRGIGFLALMLLISVVAFPLFLWLLAILDAHLWQGIARIAILVGLAAIAWWGLRGVIVVDVSIEDGPERRR